MSVLRKRTIHKPQDYYKDSVRLTQGKYHALNDQWDGGPKSGWTDAYNGHSSRLSIREQRDTLKLQARHLLLEEMSLAKHSRIEQLATTKLGMKRPATEKEIAVSSK